MRYPRRALRGTFTVTVTGTAALLGLATSIATAQTTQAPTPAAFREVLEKLRPKVEPYSAAQIDEIARKTEATSCFWLGTVSPTTFNILLPDTGSTYWVSQYLLPAGAKLQLRGSYPHARHISFSIYDANGQPVDRVNDLMIVPDAGAANPFLPGARRDAAQRAYTVKLEPREIKAGMPIDEATRAPGTLYASQDGGTVQLWYRTYVPDEGYDSRGGVALPEPVMNLADGSRVEGKALCDTIVKKEGAIRDIRIPADALKATYAIQARSKFQPAQEEPKWEPFFNAGLSASRTLIGTAYESLREAQSITRLGGFYSTLDNTYMGLYVDNRIGNVLVLRGKAPTTPRTRNGERTMAAADLRYWSVCKYRSLSDTAVDACLYDEQVPHAKDGTVTIVMSKPEDRPANARTECGVAWLPWGIGDGLGNPHGGILLVRHMMPSPEFRPHSIFATARLDDTATVLGDYYPKLRYTSRDDFEKQGCAAT